MQTMLHDVNLTHKEPKRRHELCLTPEPIENHTRHYSISDILLYCAVTNKDTYDALNFI